MVEQTACYARHMDVVVLWLLGIGLVVLTVVAFGRMAWRILSGEDEFEPGGSYGRQAIGPYRADRDDRAPRRGRLRRWLSDLADSS